MEPLVFEPYLRPQIWGGRSLARFGKDLPDGGRYGESWEVSAHPHHISVVSEGPHQGKQLTELLATHREEILGDVSSSVDRFPLLIKLLDCAELLSVQVHPNDETANRLRPGELGKTEAWVVLDVADSGEIYAGLKPGVTESEFRKHVEAGTTGECLHRFRPNVGDCLFIPAGTVHTLGGGILVAEVQQSSDATFRLFDWNRVDSEGKARPLHIAESLASINWEAGPVSPVTPSPIESQVSSVHGERLVEDKYFRLDRYDVAGSFPNPATGSMSIWMVVSGTARLSGEGYDRQFSAGETVLVSSSCPSIVWQPAPASESAQILSITLPTATRK